MIRGVLKQSEIDTTHGNVHNMKGNCFPRISSGPVEVEVLLLQIFLLRVQNTKKKELMIIFKKFANIRIFLVIKI